MRLDYASDKGLGRITLVGASYNTLEHPVFADRAVLNDFLKQPELKAVIVQGEGRHFCAGADVAALKTQSREPEALAAWMNEGKALLETLSFATVPILAMIRGSCLGAGLEIAMACHFRFVSQNAMLGFPEVEHGWMPGFGGTILTRESLGAPRLVELILSGRMLRAPEAGELGLVDRVTSTGELEQAALAFLDSLTGRRRPELIHAIMESIHNGRRLPVEEALRRETELFCRIAQKHEPDHG